MKVARLFLRNVLSAAVLAASGGFFAASPAAAYDDKSTVTAVMELMGVQSGEDVNKIDYSERPQLVLPPGQQRSAADPRAARRSPVLDRSRQTGAVSATPPYMAGAPRGEALIEPPAAYKQPTKDLSNYRDSDSKSSWWNPLSYVRGEASKPKASGSSVVREEETGAIASLRNLLPGSGRSSEKDTASQPSTSSFAMPNFVRGSDKD